MNVKKYFIAKNYHKAFLEKIYSPIISNFEGFILENIIRKKKYIWGKHQPIFILGLPRSGTTFVYQLTSYIVPCLYIDNFMERFSSSPVLAFWLRNLIWKDVAHTSFTSSYGVTSSSGMNAPNQGINFWYHWFPNTNHNHDINDLSEKTYRNIRNTINYLTDKYDKPFLFKELSLSQKLPIIRKLFPDSKIIIVEEGLVQNAIRILNAMRVHRLSDGVMWGGFFKGYEKFLHLDKERMVAYQVVYLKHYMEIGLGEFSSNQIFRIKFDDLYIDLDNEVERIKKFTGISSDRILPKGILQNKKTYDASLLARMSAYVKEAEKNLSRGWNLE